MRPDRPVRAGDVDPESGRAVLLDGLVKARGCIVDDLDVDEVHADRSAQRRGFVVRGAEEDCARGVATSLWLGVARLTVHGFTSLQPSI